MILNILLFPRFLGSRFLRARGHWDGGEGVGVKEVCDRSTRSASCLLYHTLAKISPCSRHSECINFAAKILSRKIENNA